MSHTPGPWTVNTHYGYPWHVNGNADVDTVCRIGGHKTAVKNEEENEANARLIAAAPDLRAACVGGEKYPILWPIAWAELLAKEYRRVLEAAKELGYEDEDPEATSEMLITVEEFHRKLRAAIAQAEEPR